MRWKSLGLLGALVALSLCLTPALADESPAAEKGPIAPKAGTPEATLRDGLRLIADGKFDQWVARYCHKQKLCPTPQATKSLKRYNLVAAQRLVSHCLKGDKKDQLEITRRVEEGEDLKLFLACHAKGMPRPFTLRKDGDAWKFRRI